MFDPSTLDSCDLLLIKAALHCYSLKTDELSCSLVSLGQSGKAFSDESELSMALYEKMCAG